MDKHPLQVTAFLHIGETLLPKSFAMLPRVGEFILTDRFGKLVVVRIEYDMEGDPHLYLEQGSGQAPAPAA